MKPTDIDVEVESTADLQPKSSYRTKAKRTAEELITQEMFDDAKFVLNFVPGPWTARRTLLALRGAIFLVEHEVERLVREAARGR